MSIDLGFGLPGNVLARQFFNVFTSSFKGIQNGSRDATREYLGDFGARLQPEITEDFDGVSGDITLELDDASGLGTSYKVFKDGSLGFSCSFIATNKEALVALIDAAASALTEMDGVVLREGLHNS